MVPEFYYPDQGSGPSLKRRGTRAKIIFDNMSFVWDKMILIKRKE
jgi:hypothetical protein